MRFKGLSKGFFILILFIVTVAFFDIVEPYYSSVLWAAILAVIFYPMNSRLKPLFAKRNGLAALVTVVVICVIVITPLAIVLSSMAVEFNNVYDRLQHNNTQLPAVLADVMQHLPLWVKHSLAQHHLDTAASIQQKLSQVALQGGQYLAGSVFMIGKSSLSFAVGFGIMLYLLFFLLKDGSWLVNVILRSLPLTEYVKHHLLVKFAAVSRATVKGTVVVALVQGVLGGLAFYFTGIEGSLLWGALIAFLSLIPAVGSAIVWVPAAAYFFFSGMIWQGIFLVVFFVVVIGLVDNILRPLLVGKDTKMPDYLILISTLGGMEIYGINGFVIGPLIAALFIACWNLLSGRDNEANSEEIDEDFIEEGKAHPDA
ncbi:AI-2E family transporter [Erwinia psidii]|uniref:AI-2E family transporter n=1 Tax=Erwinia psidii TaxID=69224 RepID=A0A3N6UQ61_9GAMM|nr:AI-2E family transporter [Erwinia psidii]MCX8958172.1 AI-2E family transporter [Erwinia psidii]MCX8963149.1 AI-2E family transporter [Erwinia psidii]RQM38099.1 AI-2E family transporter [Erwinia psidii]